MYVCKDGRLLCVCMSVGGEDCVVCMSVGMGECATCLCLLERELEFICVQFGVCVCSFVRMKGCVVCSCVC